MFETGQIILKPSLQLGIIQSQICLCSSVADGIQQVGTHWYTWYTWYTWYALVHQVGTRAKSVISRHPSEAGPSIKLAITIKPQSADLLWPPSFYSLFRILLVCPHWTEIWTNDRELLHYLHSFTLAKTCTFLIYTFHCY